MKFGHCNHHACTPSNYPIFFSSAAAKGKAIAVKLGASTTELRTATQAEFMIEAGRHLAFDIHSDARELRRAGIDVQGILDADVGTLDEAVAFLGAKGFSRGEADTLGPAVMAKLGWSKGGGTSGEQGEARLRVRGCPPWR